MNVSSKTSYNLKDYDLKEKILNSLEKINILKIDDIKNIVLKNLKKQKILLLQ